MIIPEILKQPPFNGNYQPNRIAVAGSNGDLTYAEFFNLIELCKSSFKNFGLTPGNPLFIYGHKECEIPALMLAAMDFDIPWIPIDPAFPEERIKSIMNACGKGLAIDITQKNLLPDSLGMIPLGKFLQSNNLTESSYTDLNLVFNKQISYVLFTSGTTGKPKGVCISRENLLSFITWLKHDYPYAENEVMFNHALFTFDVSLYDVFAALLSAGTMVLNSKDVLSNPSTGIERIKEYSCTCWTSTPALAHVFLTSENFNSEYLPELRNFVFAGEPLPRRTIELLHYRFPGKGVFNAYGPTEATVTTTLVNISHEILHKYNRIPVGFPKSDNSIGLLEIPGSSELEIIIRGDHVSPGYLNRPDLNAIKFFNSFGMNAYHTGDKGYFEDGLLFVTGRIDDQIKFNGYRIEPGEIESVLLNILPEGAIAAVIPLKKDQEVKRLIAAIYLPEESLGLVIPDIQAMLSRHLPKYMIPSEYFLVYDWPLNSNGKTDKKALLDRYLNENV